MAMVRTPFIVYWYICNKVFFLFYGDTTKKIKSQYPICYPGPKAITDGNSLTQTEILEILLQFIPMLFLNF